MAESEIYFGTIEAVAGSLVILRVHSPAHEDGFLVVICPALAGYNQSAQSIGFALHNLGDIPMVVSCRDSGLMIAEPIVDGKPLPVFLQANGFGSPSHVHGTSTQFAGYNAYLNTIVTPWQQRALNYSQLTFDCVLVLVVVLFISKRRAFVEATRAGTDQIGEIKRFSRTRRAFALIFGLGGLDKASFRQFPDEKRGSDGPHA